ncbi:hypothetical protein FHS16_005245 [Paenibacillus endophyticus]|uniref:Uncharacterized protein n=1 Tax=Paenibacillus endophyticus TaxID=1294268 RepID=A0A7W5CCL3_9BACL|nr:hypothetical protein [Paenibacillus endophyticus]
MKLCCYPDRSDDVKYDVAKELGVPLQSSDNGD